MLFGLDINVPFKTERDVMNLNLGSAPPLRLRSMKNAAASLACPLRGKLYGLFYVTSESIKEKRSLTTA